MAFVASQAVSLDTNTASSDFIQLYAGSKATLAASLDRFLLLFEQDCQLLSKSQIRGSQLRAVSDDVADQNKDLSCGAHFSSLPGY